MSGSAEPTVEIRFTTHARGRGLFATRAFRPGECVLRERALLAAQFAANRALVGAACAHCLRTFEPAETSLLRYLPAPAAVVDALPLPDRERFGVPPVGEPIRCEACRGEIYCSVACRDEAAEQYHRYLCLANDTTGALRQLRALTATSDDDDAVVNPHWPMLIARMLAMERVVAEEDDTTDNDDDAPFCHYCGQSAAEAALPQLLRCSGCHAAYYCSDMCRKCDWRYHRPCSADAPSARRAVPRLRVFGRFAHAAPDDFRALAAVHRLAAHYADAPPDQHYLDAPLQCHHATGAPEAGGAARVALWRVHLDLLRRSPLYTPALDSLFTLPVYVRLWNVLTLNATAVAPQSLFLSYFFDVVRAAREDMPSVRKLVHQLRPITAQLETHRARVESVSGAALFPLQSVINHACSANVTFAYNQVDATIDVVALAPIEPHFELFANYLSPAMQAADTRTRRRILAAQYLFKCHCSMCRLDDNDDNKDKATE